VTDRPRRRHRAAAPVVTEVWRGMAYPLGASYDGSGTNFSLFSEVAERIELCLFDADDAERGSCFRRSTASSGTVSCQYRTRPAVRVPGARAIRPRRRSAVQPEQTAAGPYSKAIDGTFDWNQSLFGYNFGDPDSRNDDDSAASMPKAVVINPFFDWVWTARRDGSTPTPSSTRRMSRD